MGLLDGAVPRPALFQTGRLGPASPRSRVVTECRRVVKTG
jgi:hypothetical protein